MTVCVHVWAHCVAGMTSSQDDEEKLSAASATAAADAVDSATANDDGEEDV